MRALSTPAAEFRHKSSDADFGCLVPSKSPSRRFASRLARAYWPGWASPSLPFGLRHFEPSATARRSRRN